VVKTHTRLVLLENTSELRSHFLLYNMEYQHLLLFMESEVESW